MALIAEDLLLLLLDDETGELRGASQTQVALGGAVLSELAIAGHVSVPAKGGFLKAPPKVVATGAPPPEHPLLVESMHVVLEKPRTAQALVERLGKGLKDRITTELVGRGILREEKDRVLGLFPRTRWPATDVSHEADVRRALEATLVHGVTPEPRTGALIALLSAVDATHKVLDTQGLSNREVRKRAKEIAQGEWAAKGVSDAIAATTAAIIAATTASTAAVAASSS